MVILDLVPVIDQGSALQALVVDRQVEDEWLASDAFAPHICQGISMRGSPRRASDWKSCKSSVKKTSVPAFLAAARCSES